MPTLSRTRILDWHVSEQLGTEAFVYRPVNGNGYDVEAAGGRLDPSVRMLWGPSPAKTPAAQIPTSEEVAVGEQRAYEAGFREAESRLRGELEKLLEAERTRITKAIGEFGREKQSYYQRVETEVVSLSLSIARKILHREVQIDPMLMAGMVRVALEKISTGSSVKLRVPPGEVSRWIDLLENQEGLEPKPEVVADAAIAPGECLLETEVGTTELSIETQIKEIENGFLDLLAVKPE